MSVKIGVIFGVRFERRNVNIKANLHENWNMQTLFWTGVFWVFLPNIVKIDLCNFELYHLKVGAFLRHFVIIWKATLTSEKVCPFLEMFMDFAEDFADYLYHTQVHNRCWKYHVKRSLFYIDKKISCRRQTARYLRKRLRTVNSDP